MALDVQLFSLLNGMAGQSSLFDSIIVFFASYVSYLLVLLFAALVFFSQYPRREKWEMVLVAGISSVIARFGAVEIIRFFYHRPRPFSVLPTHQLLTNGEWSFPSGHAAFFFALATAVYLYNKKWGVGFFAAAALVAVSRVVAGVHYPSDIVGGALVGAIIGYVAFRIARATIFQTQKP